MGEADAAPDASSPEEEKARAEYAKWVSGRGLHSFPVQLNLSAFHVIGGARRGYVARVKGVGRGCVGRIGCFLVSDTAEVEQKSE
jgi:hypothetical protein